MSLFQSWAALKAQHGKALVTGTLTPADEDVDVVTGLSVVDDCGVSMQGVPAATHAYTSCKKSSTAGSINILCYESDFTFDGVTPVAVSWWAVGDK
jgi:hypothetical protein